MPVTVRFYRGEENSPRAGHQVFADVDYRMPLGSSDWTFFTGANISMVSTSFAQVHNLAETGGSAVPISGIGFENENFKIQGYVKNLTDEDSVAQILRYADGNDSFKREFHRRPPPRSPLRCRVVREILRRQRLQD